MTKLADRLRRARYTAEMTCDDLSHLSGVPTAQIKRLEKGYEPFSDLEVVLLSDVLGTALDDSRCDSWIASHSDMDVSSQRVLV